MLENITTIQIGSTGKTIFIPDADTIQNLYNRVNELETTVGEIGVSDLTELNTKVAALEALNIQSTIEALVARIEALENGSITPIIPVIPETIDVDGVTYYKTQPEKPGENYELHTHVENDVTYYAWIEIVAPEPEIPETIDVDGVTYYKTQPEKPGENYELHTHVENDVTYYAWIEIVAPEPEIPETIDVDGVTYYKTQPEKPGENYELHTHVENDVTYYAWIEIVAPEPEIPETIDVDGVTYYKTQPEKPGENYELHTHVENDVTYYAWIEIVAPEPETYSFISYADANGETEWATGTVQTTGNTTTIDGVDYSEAEVIANSIDGWVGQKFYIVSNAQTDGTIYRLRSVVNNAELDIWVTISLPETPQIYEYWSSSSEKISKWTSNPDGKGEFEVNSIDENTGIGEITIISWEKGWNGSSGTELEPGDVYHVELPLNGYRDENGVGQAGHRLMDTSNNVLNWGTEMAPVYVYMTGVVKE